MPLYTVYQGHTFLSCGYVSKNCGMSKVWMDRNHFSEGGGGGGGGVEEEIQSLCKISLKLVLSEVYMS